MEVIDTQNFPCGVPGGLDFSIFQLEEGYVRTREFEVASGENLLDSNDNPNCDTSVEVSFDRVFPKSSKSSKSSKKSKGGAYKASKCGKAGKGHKGSKGVPN